MPDHVHLILSPRDTSGVTEIVRLFKGNSTRTSWKIGFNGNLWQKSYHDHILRKEENLTEAIQYVLNNPVRAGLVSEHSKYKYCGVMDEIGE